MPHSVKPGYYDSRLKIFLEMMSYLLNPNRLQYLEKTILREKIEVEVSNTTKLLIILEETLFFVKLDLFLQKSDPLLPIQKNLAKNTSSK